MQLAQALAVAGPVLVVAKGKRECENLAAEMAARLELPDRMVSDELQADGLQRLDSRLERELYADVPMRELLKSRIVYHHAGLPPRVRNAVEEVIRVRFHSVRLCYDDLGRRCELSLFIRRRTVPGIARSAREGSACSIFARDAASVLEYCRPCWTTRDG